MFLMNPPPSPFLLIEHTPPPHTYFNSKPPPPSHTPSTSRFTKHQTFLPISLYNMVGSAMAINATVPLILRALERERLTEPMVPVG